MFPTSQTYACSSTTIGIGTYANDADQPGGGLKVVFHWTLSNPRVPATRAVSGVVNGRPVARGSNRYEGTTASFNGKTFYAGLLTVYAVTTDKYGGTTTSSTGKFSMSCQ